MKRAVRISLIVLLVVMVVAKLGAGPALAVSSTGVWSKPYGGNNNKAAYALVQTSDGGYALAGYTDSFGAGSDDFWLVKTDASGNMQWNRTYGGTDLEEAFALVQTSDGGYALAGFTDSFGLGGGSDFWLVKTDASGNSSQFPFPLVLGVSVGVLVAVILLTFVLVKRKSRRSRKEPVNTLC